MTGWHQATKIIAFVVAVRLDTLFFMSITMRRPQFRLSTLLWITLAVGCWFGGQQYERSLDVMRPADAEVERPMTLDELLDPYSELGPYNPGLFSTDGVKTRPEAPLQSVVE